MVIGAPLSCPRFVNLTTIAYTLLARWQKSITSHGTLFCRVSDAAVLLIGHELSRLLQYIYSRYSLFVQPFGELLQHLMIITINIFHLDFLSQCWCGTLRQVLSELLLGKHWHHEEKIYEINPNLRLPCRQVLQHGSRDIKVIGPLPELNSISTFGTIYKNKEMHFFTDAWRRYTRWVK